MRRNSHTPDAAEASPQKSVIEELEALRKTLRAVIQRYASRMEDEIIQLRERVIAGRGRSHAGDAAQMRDLRDMLMLLRSLQLKPDASRRKDLKKIESVMEDLRLLAEQWQKG